MTDESAPQPGRSNARNNPPPRPALPRRTGSESRESAGLSGVAPLDSKQGTATADDPSPVAGRDLLIAASAPAGAQGQRPNGPTRSKARPLTVPTVADLMPQPDPHRRKSKPSPHPRTSSKDAAAAPRFGRPVPVPGKQVELLVELPKSLRKRLKAKAADNDLTPEEAVVHLIAMWVDG
jgi:hypothetical protein